MTNTQKEAKRKKSLGEMGELLGLKALVDNNFESIKNTNDTRNNYPFADLSAIKDGVKYAISVKTRNRLQANGKLNPSYNIDPGKFDKFKHLDELNGVEAFWMAVVVEETTYSIYFGAISELTVQKIPIARCENGELGICLERDKKHFFDASFFINPKKELISKS